MSKVKCQAGVTLPELLLVVGLVALIGASVTPFLSNFVLRNHLETTTDKIIGSLRKAQAYAIDGKNNTTWGVCLSDSDIRLFGGSCGSPTFSEDFGLPKTVTISGLPTVTFSRLRGEPSNALSIIIATNIDSRSVYLNEAGGIDVQ